MSTSCGTLLPALAKADDRTALETWLAQVDAARLHAAWRPRRGSRRWSRCGRGRVASPLGGATHGAALGQPLHRAADLRAQRRRARRRSGSSSTTGRRARGRPGVLCAGPSSRRAATSATSTTGGWSRRCRRSRPRWRSRRARAWSPRRRSARTTVIDGGLPTLIWDTHRIGLEPPPDAPGRHVWSIEVLLGGQGLGRVAAIVTFDARTARPTCTASTRRGRRDLARSGSRRRSP